MNGGAYGIFVEAVAEIGTGKPGVAGSVVGLKTGAVGKGFAGEHRVFVGDFIMNVLGRMGQVERDKVVGLGG